MLKQRVMKTDCRRTSRSFGPPFLRSSSFLFFFKKVFEFCGSCSSLFSFFFSLFFFFFSPLLLLFSRVCSAPEFYVARVIKLFFLSFFLSFRARSVFEERERRERGNKTDILRLSLGFFGVDSQNDGKSEREREILLLCVSRKRRRQTRE